MSANTSSGFYILKDAVPGKDLVLSGPGGQLWSSFENQDLLGGSSVIPTFTTDTVTAGLSYSFVGTSAAFIGLSATSSRQDFIVSVDKLQGETSSDPLRDRLPVQSYMQWYESPVLPEGSHQLDIANLHGQSIDFLLITPGPNTSLKGETVLVDDSNVDIAYDGAGWQEIRGGQRAIKDGRLAVPLDDGIHETAEVGDALQFTFFGSNLRVYGILTGSPGDVFISYTVDGSPKTQRIHSSSPENLSGTPIDRMNYLLLDTGSLSTGKHEVRVVLEQLEGADQKLIVDYLTYAPSFDNLASMPSPANGTIVGTPSEAPARSSGISKSLVGPIVGGVVGGVLFICLAIGLLFWIQRRRYLDTKQRTANEAWVIEGGKLDSPRAEVVAGELEKLESASVEQHGQIAVVPQLFFTSDSRPTRENQIRSSYGFTKMRMDMHKLLDQEVERCPQVPSKDDATPQSIKKSPKSSPSPQRPRSSTAPSRPSMIYLSYESGKPLHTASTSTSSSRMSNTSKATPKPTPNVSTTSLGSSNHLTRSAREDEISRRLDELRVLVSYREKERKGKHSEGKAIVTGQVRKEIMLLQDEISRLQSGEGDERNESPGPPAYPVSTAGPSDGMAVS